MKKSYQVRVNYIIHFDYNIKADDPDEAENKARALTSEEYQNGGTFDIDEEIAFVQLKK